MLRRSEQSADQEVDRDKVGQFVTLNGQFARIRQRPPPLRVTRPYNKIGVAALVAGAGMHDLAQVSDDEFVTPYVRHRWRRGPLGRRRYLVRIRAMLSVVPSWWCTMCSSSRCSSRACQYTRNADPGCGGLSEYIPGSWTGPARRSTMKRRFLQPLSFLGPRSSAAALLRSGCPDRPGPGLTRSITTASRPSAVSM